MEYVKTIFYSNIFEIYEYEKRPKNIGSGRKVSVDGCVSGLSIPRKVSTEPDEIKRRRSDSVKRASVAFKRLVSANLGQSNFPVFASITYAENQKDPGQGHKDFNTFARDLRSQFGSSIRYIAVSEFQKRGAIHFHALIWGLPFGVVESERDSRLVAGIWGRGFVDLIQTDGHRAISTYMAKYMQKNFTDPRMFSKKAYIVSKNCLRPRFIKNDLLQPYFHGIAVPDLSTATLVQEVKYLTQWLGECRYRLLELI